MKGKFKVGQKVRVKHFEEMPKGWVPYMMWLMGKEVEITSVEDNARILFAKPVGGKLPFCFEKTEVEPLNNATIVIYRKDDKVIALDKSTGEKAVARCHPEDEFDFKTGAKLAFMRLVDPCSEEIPFIAKPKVLNTKICITKSGGFLTTGRIYEIKDGKFKDDIGNEFPIDEPISDITSLKKYFTFGGHTNFCGSDVEFVEVVE